MDESTSLKLAESTTPGGQLAAFWALPFDVARAQLDERVRDSGLLQLGVIDTTAILEKNGLAIPNIHQVLAFHPRFMRVILETDPAAIVEAPLKFTLIERDGGTELRCADPAASFGRYDSLGSIATELRTIADSILV